MEISEWLDRLIALAIQSRTSDMHFEPQRDTFVIRFRIDGILRLCQTFEKTHQANFISKIKVMANMNITEHRMPQDGHFEYQHQDKIYNFRVSSLPTVYGEAIVMRLLNREDVLIKLEHLGFTQDQLAVVQPLVSNTSGMILTTGPTGSGKTNLIYSILHTLNKPEVNIITLEDPIEYEIPGIRQTQINEQAGVTFASTIRTVVRQDPNIIMVGEIRDSETAQIAMQASLTGILLFSTFHTFDIPALVERFLEMGSTNAVIAQSIVGIISTRLIRKVCVDCTIQYPKEQFNELPEYIKKSVGIETLTPGMKKGIGCATCQKTGYKGRTGIFEIIYFDKEIKAAIAEKSSSEKLYELLNKKNIKSLRSSGQEKILQGITTPEEVVRVLGIASY